MHRSHFATAGGLAAILLWSTTVAVARSLSEQVGPVAGAAGVYSVSGVIALASLFRNGDRRRQILRLPTRYLVGCGSLFVGYMLLLYLAIGLAESSQGVLQVGLLNYLWPTLTLLFSLVLLGNRGNWVLVPGTLLTLAGVFLVLTQGAHDSFRLLSGNLWSNSAAYTLALAAAVSWAMYSNLTRKWAGGRTEGGVALFLPITAIFLLLICFISDESREWSARSAAETLFLGVATYSGYALWDKAMRGGKITLVVAFSYLTPFFSTLLTCLYLDVTPGGRLWVGCGALIAGSILSWWSVTSP